ncbi:MAG TPA: RNA-binding protein [Firmicutes bacterium]|nr:RNA-binding protein [Bacillota bacterium]
MTKTIYVGNLPWAVTEEDLAETFSQYGAVEASRIALDRETQRSRGFGFVEMNDNDAARAIEALNNTEWGGRIITVSEAKERPARH